MIPPHAIDYIVKQKSVKQIGNLLAVGIHHRFMNRSQIGENGELNLERAGDPAEALADFRFP